MNAQTTPVLDASAGLLRLNEPVPAGDAESRLWDGYDTKAWYVSTKSL